MPWSMLVKETLEKIGRAIGPIERVGAEPDTHVPRCTRLRDLGIDRPPRIAKKFRRILICHPARCVMVRIIHLNPADAHRVEQVHLPDQTLHIQVFTRPPPKGDFAITRRRILKSRPDIQRRFARREPFAPSQHHTRQQYRKQRFFHPRPLSFKSTSPHSIFVISIPQPYRIANIFVFNGIAKWRKIGKKRYFHISRCTSCIG